VAHRDIVVIGASAGGLQALQQILSAMPRNVEAALLAVLHTADHSGSMLPQILQRRSNMPVFHPRDRDRIQRGRVYIAPPGFHMIVEIEKSNDPELLTAFRTHLEETKGHPSMVESLIQRNIGESKTETCKVINGLTTEASDTIKDVTDSSIRDIALIGAAQQVEHHEIAVYGTLRRWAEILGLADDAMVLQAIEAQEINADELLSEIAERVNFQVAA
jgi:ferritin-like metal-binding protein YciE